MPPRRSTRSRFSSKSETPSTTDGSIFSKPSMPTTPASEMDVDSPKPLPSTTKSSKKRVAESESDGSIEAKPTKRRAITKQVYVQVPTSKMLGGAKATTAAKGKGRAAARTLPPPSSDLDEGEIVPDSELEFRDPEDVIQSESSDRSDDDFVPGEASQSDVSEDQESHLPLGVSMATPSTSARFSSSKAGPSFKTQRGRRSATDTRSRVEASDSSDSDDPIVVSKRAHRRKQVAPVRSRGRKGVGPSRRLAGPRRGRGRRAESDGSQETDVSDGLLEPSEDDAKPPPKGLTPHQIRTSIKAAERRARKKLGNKLTPREKATVQLHLFHPELKSCWGDLKKSIAVVVPEKAEQPKNLRATLLPFQQESLHWMRKQECGPWSGGILADEMGMGKTIQMISLLVSDQERPNLVIAPTVAIMQWKHEIETHTEGLKVLVWHGGNRSTNTKEITKYDVVLSTYAVLESCFRKQQYGFKRKGQIVKEASPLHKIQWRRAILDEAHNIKERSTSTAKAAFELKTRYRWCLSGTPLQNRVGELYSLVRFLGGDPFSYYFCRNCDCKSLHWKFSDKRQCDDCGHSPMKHVCLWNHEILGPIQKNGMGGPGDVAFKKLKILLDRMMLRRTKIQKADDLGLPPRTVVVRRDYFSPEEKELYLSLFSDAKRQFSTYVDSGTVLNNYSNIFSLLTRMRQMACHPDLMLKSKTNASSFDAGDVGEATICRICNDIAEDAIQSKCRHVFDRECIKQYIGSGIERKPTCPVCHVSLTIDLEAPALELEENTKPRQGIIGRINLDQWRSSSKIEALMEELNNLRKKDATTKSIVFSQFVNFLDLVAFRLQNAGFQICRLEGTMSPQARDATIQYFMNNVHVTVFLISLKAGGVALNLTEASTVFLMDSWWNPAVEYQAMDRIHRLGQHRPVKAIKIVIEDSIESRIIQLQEKKMAMVDATLSADDQAMGRLTPADLGFLFRL